MIDWTGDEVELSGIVRGGRTLTLDLPDSTGLVTSLTMEYADLGGDGVVVTLDVGDTSAQLFADTRSWCEWLAPLLAVPEFKSIPVELRVPTAHWVLMPFVSLATEIAAKSMLSVPKIVGVEEAAIVHEFACTLTLRRGEQILRLRVLSWPFAWLSAFAGFLEPLASGLSPLASQRVCLTLAAGCVKLSKGQIARLRPGRAIVLDMDAQIEFKEVLLVVGRPLALIGYLDEEEWLVNDVVQESAWLNASEDANEVKVDEMFDSMRFTVVAEIGRIELTLAEIRSLERGMPLQGPASFDGGVTLRVNGCEIGRGRLVRVGGRLVVRIE